MVNIEPGMIVFTKSFSLRTKNVSMQFRARPKTQEICMLIGTLKDTQALPTPDECVELLGAVGYFSGDLIAEVFGEKGFQKMVTAFKKRYVKAQT